jgi:hypothetical protein
MFRRPSKTVLSFVGLTLLLVVGLTSAYGSANGTASRTLEAWEPPAESKGVVAFLHMHKAAGSAICKLAQANQMRITEFQKTHNCNFKGDGPNITPADSIGKSCPVRTKELADHNGVQFFGIERFGDYELCKDFTYITVLREPLERIASHYNYEKYKEHLSPPPIAKAILKQAGAKAGQAKNAGPRHWCSMTTQTLNNYYIRTLLGHKTYMLDLEAIKDEHFIEAYRMLEEEFTLELISERWDESLELLQKAIGWTPSKIPERQAKKNKHKPFEQFFTTQEKTTLKTLNLLDIQLYNRVDQELFTTQLN